MDEKGKTTRMGRNTGAEAPRGRRGLWDGREEGQKRRRGEVRGFRRKNNEERGRLQKGQEREEGREDKKGRRGEGERKGGEKQKRAKKGEEKGLKEQYQTQEFK